VGARQIYILPTGTGLLYGAVALLMLVGSLNYQNNLGLLFTFLMVSVGLVAMHHCWLNLLGLKVSSHPGPPVFAGTKARFEIDLFNDRTGARFDLTVGAGGGQARLAILPGAETLALSLGVATAGRGLLPLEEVRVETRHPLDLLRAWCWVSCGAAVLVYPRPAERAPAPPALAGDRRLPGAGGGEGAEDFLGPRDYRRGDSPRRLDWKAAARGRGLVVKQFAGDRGQELALDWGALPAMDPERRIALLARQAIDAGAAGVRFTLRLPGIEVAADRGEPQVRRCLAQLALFDHGEAPQAPLAQRP
jgi:uncharacterized protein (DUF58 family)